MKPLKPITGRDPLGNFAYHLDFRLPYIAMAIHAGHHVRKELLPYMALNAGQREFEEDTATDLMIKGLGNSIWALESRSVYDLNRPPNTALPLTPEKFWGTRVYKEQPSTEMIQKSLNCYASFYKFIEKCVKSILNRFGICIIYDIHSYNISRQHAKGIESPPVFNLGTGLIDTSKWKQEIDLWLELLGDISLPGIKTTVAENVVFRGTAEFSKRISGLDKRILVLPTEISKVYMDEISGNLFSNILDPVKLGLQNAIISHITAMPKT